MVRRSHSFDSDYSCACLSEAYFPDSDAEQDAAGAGEDDEDSDDATTRR